MIIFMEYCAQGTIEYVAKQGLPEEMIRQYTRDILMAIHFLHEKNIVHRDIKGPYRNVFSCIWFNCFLWIIAGW